MSGVDKKGVVEGLLVLLYLLALVLGNYTSRGAGRATTRRGSARRSDNRGGVRVNLAISSFIVRE